MRSLRCSLPFLLSRNAIKKPQSKTNSFLYISVCPEPSSLYFFFCATELNCCQKMIKNTSMSIW